MAKINKFLISVHQDGFSWENFESKVEPSIKDGFLTVKLANETRSYNLQKVNQYKVQYETEE
ncbi:hypothetical protein IB212_15540 [Enterobacter sp. E12]|uniref:hypothetical protein n=1 Tax=Enterobacter sp. E12 TaxID=2769348 RepID=UPI001661513D|nr:hypothetical protein [Enterobacter sp. E12]MBD0815545.1 hypothetical protein [Enterobacter sp. E12]